MSYLQQGAGARNILTPSLCTTITQGVTVANHLKMLLSVLMKNEFIGPKNKMMETDEVDTWITKSQVDCLFCAEPFLRSNYKDSVKDHCHITGKYRGAAYNACNLKLRINPKTVPIPVVFHNLRGYGPAGRPGKLYRQQHGKVHLIFSWRFTLFDSLNFFQSSVDSLVKCSSPEIFKTIAMLE